MRVLHFDWETDGLNIGGQPSDHPDQPGGVSLTAVLDDENGNTIDTFDTLIIPVRPIPPEAVAIHGISTQLAQTQGINISDVMDRFAGMAQQADVLSSFNFFFDFKMCKIGCARSGEHGERIRQMLESKSSICTMDAARKHLGAARFIKLGIAYQKLTGETHQRAHESHADTQAHRRIFYRLRDLNALPDPKPIGRKVYDTPPPPRKRTPVPPDASVNFDPRPSHPEKPSPDDYLGAPKRKPGAI